MSPTRFTDAPIIVPWDSSVSASNALNRAIKLAESPEQIEVVHVTPYPAVMEPSVIWGEYSEEKIGEYLHNSYRKEIDAPFKDLNFTALFGDPGTEICNFAKAKEAGLIVISSHGRKGISRLLLGSVAERVVRLSGCPVLVLKDQK